MLKKIVLCSLLASPALASEDIADKYPASLLYSKPVEVISHVFSAIGATAPSTYENAGHNNNLSFILTGDGVVDLVTGGDDVVHVPVVVRYCTVKRCGRVNSRQSWRLRSS